MKQCFQAKLLRIIGWMCMVYCMFMIQSCSNNDEPVDPDEPTVVDPSESIKKEIVGIWIGRYNFQESGYPLEENQDYLMESELTFGSDGKVLIKITSYHFSNGELIGSQCTETAPCKYEIKDGMLECDGRGKYEILLAGDTMTIISNDDHRTLWGILGYGHNGVNYEYSPKRLTYTRN